MTKIITFALQFAPVAELVDASVSKTDELCSCRFDSGPGYISKTQPLDKKCLTSGFCFLHSFLQSSLNFNNQYIIKRNSWRLGVFAFSANTLTEKSTCSHPAQPEWVESINKIANSTKLETQCSRG